MGRLSKMSTVGITVTLLCAFMAPSLTAQADDLDDKKAQLDQAQDATESALGLLDGDIAETANQLKDFQGQLPAARAALADAQGRVSAAQSAAQALAARVGLAEQNKAKIATQIERDKSAIDDSKKSIGQIAAQAYKMGGMPSALSLMLDGKSAESTSDSMNMVNQVLRSQGKVVSALSESNATNMNSQARLSAVEDEIKDLKSQADAALVAEQSARDQAAAKKSDLDQLVSKTSALSDQLEAKRPQIQAKLADIKQAQDSNNDAIAERQRKLLEEARRQAAAEAAAERERQAQAARDQAARDQAARDQAAQGQQNAPQPAAPPANNYVPPAAPAPAAPAPVLPAPNPGGGGTASGGSIGSIFNLSYPINGPISSGWGWRATPPGTIDWYGTGGYLHTGIDFGVACGTPIYAPTDGEVWYSDFNQLAGAGNRIVLNHGVRGGHALVTNYYHMQQRLVSVGQHVDKGQVIGFVGNTGNSTGCHAHWETMVDGQLEDPAIVMGG